MCAGQCIMKKRPCFKSNDLAIMRSGERRLPTRHTQTIPDTFLSSVFRTTLPIARRNSDRFLTQSLHQAIADGGNNADNGGRLTNGVACGNDPV